MLVVYLPAADRLLVITDFKLHNDACSEGYQSPAAIEANMHKLASLGLEIHVTEMDVQLNLTTTGEVSLKQGNMTAANVSAVLQKQAAVYAGVLRACLNVPACKSWGVWGFYGRGHKDILDTELQPKPGATLTLLTEYPRQSTSAEVPPLHDFVTKEGETCFLCTCSCDRTRCFSCDRLI